jgi:hypothetical protein
MGPPVDDELNPESYPMLRVLPEPVVRANVTKNHRFAP